MEVFQRHRIREAIGAWLFLIPPLIIYGLFLVFPLIETVRLGFLDWNGISPPVNVGLDNYVELFDDPLLWGAIKNNVIWSIFSSLVPVIIGLILAAVLIRSDIPGRTFFRVVYFLPQVMSTVVIALVWRWLYHPAFGPINVFFREIGLESWAKPWLGSVDWALPALLIIWAWVMNGFAMVVFSAAIQGIPEELFDSAKVDGANPIQQFRHILVPSIRRSITIVLLLNTIWSYQVFDLVFILTSGGPGKTTYVLPFLSFMNAFRWNRVGYGSAVSVFLAVIILVFSILFTTIREREPE